MTILIASLFLPYTIHFDIKVDKGQPRKDPSSGKPASKESAGLSLFSAKPAINDAVNSTVKAAAAAADEVISFFSKSDRPECPERPGLKRGPSVLQDILLASAIAPNEPHSPAWGQTEYFVQPQLRSADYVPPASVLQRDLAESWRQLNGSPKTSNHKDSQSSSYERAMKTAEWSVQPAEQGNGGLRNAVYAAHQKGDFEPFTWIGTLSMPTDSLDDERKAGILEKLDTDFDSLVIYPKDSDFNGHYAHFCKTILWPVLHYQIPDNPKSKAYLDHSWIYYYKINQLFADKIVKNYKRGDVIWVHDYHLLLVPKLVREKLPDAQIGFFLHIAFPSSEVFRCIAVRKELLEGMLGANLIGFQTQEYLHHFLQTCNRLLRVECLPHGVQMEDRFVDVATIPIGIDPDILQLQQKDPYVLDWLGRLDRKYAGKRLIVARDKLDHVRGVRQKLLAFELLLSSYPEFREDVVMIQVATLADKQSELDATISDIATRINSTYSSLAHQPLVYLKKDLEYQQYIAMLESADVLMITSLREGMNLTAHEYILCQDGTYSQKKHGCMILSEFTGSAAVFDGHYLPVNPWDYRQCAEAMHKALKMSSKEKEQRWIGMKNIVMGSDANHWIRTFLKTLATVHDQHSRQRTVSIPRLRVNELASNYRASKRRLFMLDYEGTLASHGTPLSVSFTSPERTIRALSDLLAAQGNTVYVMSGRMPKDLDGLFRRLPGLGLIAENGCFVKHPNKDWACLPDMDKMKAWKESITKVLEYYQERLEGSIIDVRNCIIFFNSSTANDQEAAARLVGECANHLNDGCQTLKVHAVPCDGGLLIESTEFNKRTAAESVLEGLLKQDEHSNDGKLDFLMVAGDGREDEDVYRWANQLGKNGTVSHVCTVSVSSRNTEAMATLTQGVTGVLGALQNLAAMDA